MIIDQPRNSRTGEQLINSLLLSESDSFDRFYIMVAYVRKSGVDRIKKALSEFRQHGTIKAIVGIDSRNTSKEGLSLLNENVDEMYLYHNNDFYRTFHPKVYVFEKISKKAIVVIGSSNLTQGGLFTNYELCSVTELDLQNVDEKKQFDEIMATLNNYSNSDSDCCKQYTSELLDELVNLDIIPIEKMVTIRRKTKHQGQNERLAPLFGTEKFTKPQKPIMPEYRIIEEGFWKRLSRFDTSQTSAPGQIIIPKKFMRYFPPVENYRTTSSMARQGDAYFDIIFKDKQERSQMIENVRVIHYIPALTHKRPNSELRFTFKTIEISNSLEAGDILEFRTVESDHIWFEIRCLPPSLKKKNFDML